MVSTILVIFGGWFGDVWGMVSTPKSLPLLTFWSHNLYNLCSIKNNNSGVLLLFIKVS